MDDKVYEPEVIAENPFPGEDTPPSFNQSLPAGTFAPTTEKQKDFPRKKVAVELLSTALNTRSKKILQSFEFTPSGAIQIGELLAGITGDIRISPNGIVARDSAGITTIAIDGTTGDVTIKGTLQSGSVISGLVAVGDNSIVLDGESRTIVVNDGTNDRILIGYDQGGF